MAEPQPTGPTLGEGLEILPHPFHNESQAALDALQRWKGQILDYAVRNPADALFWVVTGGAMVFYLAEKEANEDVRSYGDALHYISTCLSVGYARIYPTTQIGKLVATIVMAIGPALTSWIIEGRLVAKQGATPAPPGPDLTPILGRLDAILAELQAARRTSSEQPGAGEGAHR
ncbi:MAG: two pore domain potassium channel family protein [Armatimonadetes bacterium]|nr:two pore domain potassium channel family protein [Armatimonadota bacterium]